MSLEITDTSQRTAARSGPASSQCLALEADFEPCTFAAVVDEKSVARRHVFLQMDRALFGDCASPLGDYVFDNPGSGMNAYPIRFLCDMLVAGARRLMMDLGLGGFIDKFEQYFGKLLTFVLLLLLGLALASVCVNAVVTFSVLPAMKVIQGVIERQSLDIKSLVDLLIYFLSFISVLMGGISLALAIKQRRFIITIRDDISSVSSDADAVFDSASLAVETLSSIAKSTDDPDVRAKIKATISEIDAKIEPIRASRLIRRADTLKVPLAVDPSP